jgi:hypothetical protein
MFLRYLGGGVGHVGTPHQAPRPYLLPESDEFACGIQYSVGECEVQGRERSMKQRRRPKEYEDGRDEDDEDEEDEEDGEDEEEANSTDDSSDGESEGTETDSENCFAEDTNEDFVP